MVQKVLIATAIASVLALSACQRTSYNYSQPVAPQPQPLTPAPAGQVQSSNLPPPGGAQQGTYGGTYNSGTMPVDTATAGNSGQFPAAPGAPTGSGGMGNVAAPAGAMALSNAGLVGSWKANEGGVQCDMFLTLTNLGEGLRGEARGVERRHLLPHALVLRQRLEHHVEVLRVLLRRRRRGDNAGELRARLARDASSE